MNDEFYYECPRCQIGYCKRHEVTYTRIHNGHPISAPQTPRYVCDICGYKEFDPEALENLLRMVGKSLSRTGDNAKRRPTAAKPEAQGKRKPRKNANS